MKKFALALFFFSIPLIARVQKSIEGEARLALEHAFKSKEVEEIFTDIYRTNFWHGWESISGQGSNISKTRYIRAALPDLLKKLHIKTMLDAPCGDFNWMRVVIDEFDLELYLGLDIVKELIHENQQKYGTTRRVFMYANLIDTPVPKVDLIFSRDCLAHLSYENARSVLKRCKQSGSTYLLTSHHVNTNKNCNITNGDHYPIKLTIAPFNFPDPLLIIEEKDSEMASAHQGKCLALWRLEDIDVDAILI